MSIIRCRHCGADNEFEPDVVGKLCDNCGEDVYTPEFEAEMGNKPPTPVAMPDRTGGVLCVTCPRCQFVNEFLGWSSIDIFICDGCGEPVEVKEPIQ